MALGQYVAGMGFSNVGLGIVSFHGARPGRGLRHPARRGKRDAACPPSWNTTPTATGEKYREIATRNGREKALIRWIRLLTCKAAVDAVRKLSEDVGIPSQLLEAIKEEDLPFLAESAHADACAPGNPKDASIEDLTALFRKLM